MEAKGSVAVPAPLAQTAVCARSPAVNVYPFVIDSTGCVWLSVVEIAISPRPARVEASALDVPVPNAIIPQVPATVELLVT